ncbi:MAG: cadmium-translocating P-type ATPase [Clostridia bacterium]|jgi:Cd2+/Zn2+-exporting ATPase|nr:cadmium-translocating P-type ATPase [Clostridia bacterium]MCI1999161.1 cadmium-translocating P-type ATPase [Clostridia bacterium]MCI2014886.1 cadmium-translocating P-type ATPase [Clostridia bacterium]
MNEKQKNTLIRVAISAVLVALGYFIPVKGAMRLLYFIAAYAIIGWDVVLRAVENIKNLQPLDEAFLMTIATVGAFVIGEYAEGVAVMLFYQVGQIFESTAVEKSRKNIKELMDIMPEFANLEKDGKVIRVSPEQVPKGSVIVVKPGEKIPIDGLVIKGNSVLNTAALTGESVPLRVAEGSSVSSGCINTEGVIYVKTDRRFEDSTAAKILELVENSSLKKAKAENFITKFARYYTPIVVALAVFFAIVPSVITGNWSEWFSRALIFLVVSCPCALVISVPLSFFGAIGGASKRGILIKGGNYIEAVSKAEIMVFDKTGTLTEGKFSVSEIKPKNCDENELLSISAAVESFTNHPIASSIKEAYKNAYKKEPDTANIYDIEEKAGMGLAAKYKGKTVFVGNEKLMTKNGIDYSKSENYGTVAHVAYDGQYMGYIVISDNIKRNAEKAIKELKKAGVKRTVMLTGDNGRNAKYTADKIGIDEVHYSLLPENKVDITEKLINEKTGTLIYTGDGINDAPVISRADVGIAMGGIGSDAAIEAADIVIMDDNMEKIAEAINISKKAMRIVYENVVLAIGIKVMVLILGALGMANMWEGVFADVGVAIIAIFNACRMLSAGKKEA